MGYPMSWPRIVTRNGLQGGYDVVGCRQCRPDLYKIGHSHYTSHELQHETRAIIAGDLQRFETDQRDELHLEMYARKAGVSVAQVKIVLDALFGGVHWADGLTHDEQVARYESLAKNP